MPQTKREGLAHLFAAAGYSLGGIRRLTHEPAFRQEAIAAVGLVAAYAAMDVTGGLRLAAAVLFLVLIAMEAVNTAIEEIVDRISPEISDMARYAKDLGSLAVFCLLCANAILLIYALALQFQR
ncbi:MAG: diacylglycerol kinase [Rhizobium sp.]|nr:diacylglycerol kinase [Rhizobium sp.]